MPEIARPNGAHWLYRLLTLIYGLIILITAIYAVHMIFAFPIWSSDIPRKFPLLGMVKLPSTALPAIETMTNSTVLTANLKNMHGLVEVRLGNQWFHWLGLLSQLLVFLLVTLMVRLLRLIVGSVVEGDIFNRVNARRLRWLGLAMMVTLLLGPIYHIAFITFTLRGISVGGAPIAVAWGELIDLESFVSAWIVLILSEVFRQGAKLYEDQSLTV